MVFFHSVTIALASFATSGSALLRCFPTEMPILVFCYALSALSEIACNAARRARKLTRMTSSEGTTTSRSFWRTVLISYKNPPQAIISALRGFDNVTLATYINLLACCRGRELLLEREDALQHLPIRLRHAERDRGIAGGHTRCCTWLTAPKRASEGASSGRWCSWACVAARHCVVALRGLWPTSLLHGRLPVRSKTRSGKWEGQVGQLTRD